MYRSFRLLSLIWLLCITCLFGQKVVKSDSNVAIFNNLSSENIYVHYNSSLLFSGEYLYYKVYCLSSAKTRLSDVSKIAYLEIIDSDYSTVLKQKIVLTNGSGQGDIFIPVSIPSGQYKIICYTNWMQNFEINFFEGTLNILNPYQVGEANKNFEEIKDTLVSNQSVEYFLDSEQSGKEIVLNLDKDKYESREEVYLNILSDGLSNPEGDYSISVINQDDILNYFPQSFRDFTNSKEMSENKVLKKNIKDSISLPELRGEILSGRVVINNDKPKENLAGKKILLTFPGHQYNIGLATTNTKGEFYINIHELQHNEELYVRELGYKNNQNILMDFTNKINIGKIVFDTLRITSTAKAALLQRSVYNQIDNAYNSIRPDSTMVINEISNFYGEDFENYNLENYSRFETLKETIVEIIEHVWFKVIEEDKIILQVDIKNDTYRSVNLLPMVIIDGMPVSDHTKLLNLKAAIIETINVVRKKYYFGSQIFQGIVDIKTFDGNYYKDFATEYDIKKPFITTTIPKRYYNQTYTEKTRQQLARIPDFRSQLLWMPELNLKAGVNEIRFFTSDRKGKFIISLEGLTKKGEVISLRKSFEVK
ncbi:hypothetical protein ACJRPK_12750 [Aquimarina sp. 2-A2]|uniref:hypothetical protein n=1 Tax=Aquimarina sp. 2-A2 TaxID=3382644 RepID=UPI00387F176B